MPRSLNHFKKKQNQNRVLPVSTEDTDRLRALSPDQAIPAHDWRRIGDNWSSASLGLRASPSHAWPGFAYFAGPSDLGDAISARAAVDGVAWVDALKTLAHEQGMQVAGESAPSPAPRPHRPKPIDATPPAPKPFQTPPQTDQDRVAGRAYLAEQRGIDPATLDAAEEAGALSYTRGAVVFLGLDKDGIARAATRRWIEPAPGMPKGMDVRGSQKSTNPVLLPGDPTAPVWVVEGGVDALAAHTLARAAGAALSTVIATGGAGSRRWLDRPDIQAMLKNAPKIVVWGEHESTQEKQIRTDVEHEKTAQKIKEILGPNSAVEVCIQYPPKGCKDLGDMAREQLTLMQREREEQHPGFEL